MQITSTRASTSIAGSSWHERALAREPDDTDGERDARQQDQPLGHHRDDTADRGHEPLADAVVLAVELADEQADAGRHERVRHERDDAVDRRAQLAVHERELAGLLGELGRVGVGADLVDLGPAVAGDDEAAGEQLVAGLLDDRIGLAGEQ